MKIRAAYDEVFILSGDGGGELRVGSSPRLSYRGGGVTVDGGGDSLEGHAGWAVSDRVGKGMVF